MSGLKPNQIKSEILRLGFSQKQLAYEFGVSPSQLSQVINGHRIYPELRSLLASKLRKPVKSVFGHFHPQQINRRQPQAEAV